MKLKKIILLFFCLSISGCWLNTSEPTDRYDLLCRKIGTKCQVQIMEFRNNSGAGLNFVIRRSNNRLEIVRYARWSCDPGILIARALNQAFLIDKDKVKQSIYGSLERFEAIPDERIFRMSGFFVVNKQTKRFDITTQLAGETPIDIVSAGNDALSILAERISEGVNSI